MSVFEAVSSGIAAGGGPGAKAAVERAKRPSIASKNGMTKRLIGDP
jgi:hypothetical protein